MNPPEILLTTPRFRVERVTRQLPDGSAHAREIVRHPGAVVILPLRDDGRVVLVRNYRVSVAQTLIELPAGTLEPGEEPAETARRELAEETGYRAARVERLLTMFPSPGILDEKMHVYRATGLVPGETRLEPGEQIEPFSATWDEALGLLQRGEIIDAKTIAVLLYYDRFGRR